MSFRIRHAGATERIREALREGGEMSVAEIAAHTGMPADVVRRYLAQLAARGGIASLGGPSNQISPKRYAIFDATKHGKTATSPDDFRVAGKIEIGRGSVWHAGRA